MKKYLWIVILVIIIIIAIIIWWAISGDKDSSSAANTNTVDLSANINNAIPDEISDLEANINSAAADKAINNDADYEIELIVDIPSFNYAPDGWYEHIWYNAADAEGEVTYSADGVTFTGLKSNSRSGIKTDLDVDVSEYEKLELNIGVTNSEQTLTGTGWNGREAPVAIAISYTDADGVKHSRLSEDPTAEGQIFWRGFYTLDPDSSSDTTNGIKVNNDEQYDYAFDLMTLDPKPVTLHYVGVEGAGWQEREGTVHYLNLTGYK